ncbi:MAG: DUF169 domain-containing protein [Halanaerobium sp.]
MKKLVDISEKLENILGLERKAAAVKFIDDDFEEVELDNYDSETKTRYCQALMRAGKGEKIMITENNISCPASAAAFGLKKLPEKLKKGDMLYKMGLFKTKEAGENAMRSMTRLKGNEYSAVLLAPLAEANWEPDVVVLESKPEHLMWLSLASIYESGERLKFDSAIFQATCVDSTVIPFVEGRLNSTLGCYGCREATDIQRDENLLGIPYSKLEEITENLEEISEGAMQRARAKNVFAAFNN